MAVAVVGLLLLVMFLCLLVMDYWHRWRDEKLWSEHLKGILDVMRRELMDLKKMQMIERKNSGAATGNQGK